MGILTRQACRTGELMGMPTFREFGTATWDLTTRTELCRYEHGRTVVRPMPRSRGLVAKSIDGRPLCLATLDGCAIMGAPDATTTDDNTTPPGVPGANDCASCGGTACNLLQQGKTTIKQIGGVGSSCKHPGLCIVSWERNFVQLLHC